MADSSRAWRPSWLPRIGLAALLAAVALAGCTGGGANGGSAGGDGTGGPGGSDQAAGTTTTLALAVDSPTADDVDRLLPSEEGLVDLQRVEILAVDETAPGVLLVSFEMASHHCYGIHSAVTETATEVMVDLRTGRHAGEAPAACVDGVFPYTTQVTLAGPVGDREVVTTAELSSSVAGATSTTVTATTGGVDEATSEQLDPAEIDPADIPADDVGRYVGHHVEDGVEWALANQLPWRILSEDGTSHDDGTHDASRLSFTVVADRIVGYEWS